MSTTTPLDGIDQRIEQFLSLLRDQGHADGTLNHYRRACRHLAIWLQAERIPLSAVDADVLARFAAHDCRCARRQMKRRCGNRAYLLRVQRFVRYLATEGAVPGGTSSKGGGAADALPAFRDWLRRHRGAREQTVYDHVRTIQRLLPYLGDDPSGYDAALINRVMRESLERASRINVQRMCRSLRMYLRYLASTGACSAALVGAVPRIPRWRLATLPRYVLQDDVERVIASCDLTTPRGLRDRAILLLLARLALRGGDVAHLELGDIDWDEALVTVAGKTDHAVALPLPQDVGDALLAYLERGRPRVAASTVFCRVIAPFKPLASSSAITIVVRDALARAGVRNANLRGAYLLRHSAATHLLRSGATLEAVGAVLRHRSPETTAIYAKVDTTMLAQVAQPWIGSATCR